MEKISQSGIWPEIVFGSSESKKSQAIRRAIKAGESVFREDYLLALRRLSAWSGIPFPT